MIAWTRADLADRGFVTRIRVADERYPDRLGVIVDVVSESQIGVVWDDGRAEYTSWLYLAPLGRSYAGRV